MVLHSSRASVQRSFVSFPESTSISLVAVGRYLRYNHANDANIFQSERKIVRKCSDKRVLKEKKKTSPVVYFSKCKNLVKSNLLDVYILSVELREKGNHFFFFFFFDDQSYSGSW